MGKPGYVRVRYPQRQFLTLYECVRVIVLYVLIIFELIQV